MSTIQRKIAFKDLRTFAGTAKYLHVVLKSNEAIRCQLLTMDKDKLRVRNALGHKRELNLQDIRELWFDETVPKVP